MEIEGVIVKNFRNFKDSHIDYDKINLITGPVGSGKSTLGRMAITFALYGECEVNALSDLKLKTSKKDSDCYVELFLIDKQDRIYIKREIPIKLSIFLVDGYSKEVLPGATNTDKENWIKERFGDYNYFKKFRMIDTQQGINILDEGPTSLRKTLMSFSESALNNIRKNILDKKSLYEKYNKKHLIITSCYSSVKRLELLKNKLEETKNNLIEYQKEFRKEDSIYKQKEFSEINSRKEINRLSHSIDEINKSYKCNTCNQELPIDLRKQVIQTYYDQIKEHQEYISDLRKELLNTKPILLALEEQTKILANKQIKINSLINKLDTRLKQKDYIYSDQDIVIASNAIKELDKFYSFFIYNSLKSLEPIINSVISRIGFQIEFIINKNSTFEIVLLKETIKYNYKDLSTGQKSLLSIAFKISLLLDRGESGLLIADEGFNNLTNEDIADLYELFKDYPFQLISILHRFEEKIENINIIDLRKEENATTNRPNSTDGNDSGTITGDRVPEKKKTSSNETEGSKGTLSLF